MPGDLPALKQKIVKIYCQKYQTFMHSQRISVCTDVWRPILQCLSAARSPHMTLFTMIPLVFVALLLFGNWWNDIMENLFWSILKFYCRLKEQSVSGTRQCMLVTNG